MNEEAEGNGSTWLYVAPTLHDAGLVNYPGLASVTERDRVKIEKPPLEPTRLRRGLDDRRVEGVILEMGRGWPGRHQLVATLGLLGRYHVIYYWPEEAAVERIDSHRLAHYWALWVRAKIYMRRNPMRELLTGAEVNLVVATEKERGLDVKARATEILADPRPGRLKTDADGHVPGWGVYLRTDYWAPIETGGSYGHTCYVAKELAARSDEFVCLMANRFALRSISIA